MSGGTQHEDRPQRPMRNHIQLATPYIFQHTIDECLQLIGIAPTREDNIRLAGVQWIDNVRRALRLPVRTFDTAVVYYHKFRLVHSDGEYNYVDAAAAALFSACKIEDTLKKSKDILCAAHNLKVPRTEHLSPDDNIFEHQSRTILGLERLMLEASGFDFRNRHPQQLLVKLAKYYSLDKNSTLVRTAYTMSLDLYRTFAPLKQATPVLAFACLELAGRLLNERNSDIEQGRDYKSLGINRAMVMETLLDLLDLYTHHRTSTAVGPDFPIDTFLEVRIPLNEESDARRLPRFTEAKAQDHRNGGGPSGTTSGGPRSGNPNSSSNNIHGGGGRNKSNMNGIMNHSRGSSKNVSPKDTTSPNSTNTNSTGASSGPGSGSTNATSVPGGAGATVPSNVSSNTTSNTGNSNTAGALPSRQRLSERGREGTVRFMLNPDREREERAIVAEYKQ